MARGFRKFSKALYLFLFRRLSRSQNELLLLRFFLGLRHLRAVFLDLAGEMVFPFFWILKENINWIRPLHALALPARAVCMGVGEAYLCWKTLMFFETHN